MRMIYIDGYCNLCNGFVNWLIKRDKKYIFKFASLQGETAKKFLPPGPDRDQVNTVIYQRDNEFFVRSQAVIEAVSDLGGLWKICQILLFIPRPMRDVIYRAIAKHRYLIFGKRDNCRTPTEKETSYFLK